MSKLGVVKGPDNVAVEPKSNRVNDSVPLNSRLSQFGLNIRKNVSRRAMLVAMSIAGTTAVEGCRADLPPPTIGLYFDESPDTGKDVVGGVYDLFESDAGSDTGIEDANDGSTDDVIDAEDAVDGSIDVSEVGDTGSDTGIEDTTDGSTDDVIDAEDAVDGSIDVSEVGDTGSDTGIEDTTDGSTDDVIDAEDAVDGSIDASEVGDTGSDTGIEDTADGSTDDTIDANPITCEGLAVGTVQTIPTKGPLGENGICINGEKVCAENGTWTITKSAVNPLSSELCNGQDDTCDGFTDEGFKALQPVSYDPFKVGKGICVAAVWDCINGKNKEISPEIGPAPETCNAIDDDCDSFVDNGLPTQTYFTDDVSKIGIGICKEGKKDCNPLTGNYEVSIPEVGPSQGGEICINKLDDDCDGVTDGPKCSLDKVENGIITTKFKDPEFLAATRKVLGKGPMADITIEDAGKITKLDLIMKGITDISGIEYFQNLTDLIIDNNNIKDIYPLSILTKLKTLSIEHNQIEDLSPLSAIEGLTELYFSYNKISDISVVKNLINLTVFRGNVNTISDMSTVAEFTNLVEIALDSNAIVDISALAKLVKLMHVSLQLNQIKDIAIGLLGNIGVGSGDYINLKGNPNIPVSQVNSLKQTGANVYW